MKKLAARTFAAISAAVMGFTSAALSLSVSVSAYDKNTVIIPTYDNEKPGSGCIKAALYGSYKTDIQAAIDRVNEIRLEACKEGVPNPNNPSKALKKSDYVPIEWSQGLEEVARMRAAEASLCVDHTRPNGESCFSINCNDEVFNSGEVLAFNYSATMLSGIEQFYDEKQDWVDQDSSAVTGHYEQMINPNNTYLGMGCFVSDDTYFSTSVSGRFGYSDTEPSHTKDKSTDECLTTIIVKKSYLSSPELKLVGGSKTLSPGKKARYELRVSSSINGFNSDLVLFDGIKWSSSDKNVATVDSYGCVTPKGTGKTVITASCNGFKAKKTVTVTGSFPDNTPKVSLSKAKVSISGKTYTYTGKSLKPSAKVTVNGKKLTKDKDYKITYSSNKNTGTAKAKITGIGSYTGSKTVSFYIKPTREKITRVTKPSKGKLKIYWTRKTSQATGYQIFYSRGKSFSGKKTVTVKGGSKSAKTLTGLVSKKTYYIKVRAYKQSGSKKIYGVCSPVKAVKAK